MFSNALLLNWLEKLTFEQRNRLVENQLDCPANMLQAHAQIYKNGRKYISIAIGDGIRYFVRKLDGMIFASADYRTPNFHRSFGTLSDYNDFEWGSYEAVAKPGTGWIMKPTRGPYLTAIKN